MTMRTDGARAADAAAVGSSFASPQTADWTEGQQAAIEEVMQWLPVPLGGGASAVTVEDVAVSFGGVNALRGVDLDVPARSFTSVIGPNGAGKSTLFDVINGFTPPRRGRVLAFGIDVTKARPWDRAQLGMSRTFQANHVDPDLPVMDNLMVGAFALIRGGVLAGILGTRTNAGDERRADSVARAIARLLDLERVLTVPCRSLDFGAQRRTEIGRSLMSGPRLLLLDEPSAGLDGFEARELIMVVKKLQTDLGLTVLLVEHYIRTVMENSDLIYTLDQGQVIASGTPAEIAVDAAVRAAYLGEETHA
jgi:ABC-type branched-subunit amino acid transport system ATPase component